VNVSKKYSNPLLIFLTSAKTVIFFQKGKIGYLSQIALAENENFRDGRAKCGDKNPL